MDRFALRALVTSNVITSENHGAYVTIASAIMSTIMLHFGLFRLTTRWPFRQLFASDDATIVVASVRPKRTTPYFVPRKAHILSSCLPWLKPW